MSKTAWGSHLRLFADELPVRELDPAACHPHLAGRGINEQLADPARALAPLGVTPQHRPQPRDQLLELERLAHASFVRPDSRGSEPMSRERTRTGDRLDHNQNWAEARGHFRPVFPANGWDRVAGLGRPLRLGCSESVRSAGFVDQRVVHPKYVL
jgi:hypothetical protein